jgi:hypothetical protein
MEPKTRTETKKQGKRNGGPYSAKHVRRLEAIVAATPAKKLPDTAAASGSGKTSSKERKRIK